MSTDPEVIAKQLVYRHLAHRYTFELYRRDSDQHFNLLRVGTGEAGIWLWDWDTGIHGVLPADTLEAVNTAIRWIREETKYA